MNKDNRKSLKDMVSNLTSLKATVTSIRNEEESSFYNLPASIRDGRMGHGMAENIFEMDIMLDSIEDMIDALDKLVGGAKCQRDQRHSSY